MKKMIFVLVFVSSMLGAANAQVQGKSIGVRFGNGAEVSFNTSLGSANRLELDLGLNNWITNNGNSGFGLTGIYLWVWPLDDLAPGFNWYAGVGGTVGGHISSTTNGSLGLGVAGQVGLEFDFNIPLQLSVDFRPALFIVNSHDSYNDAGFSVRYRF
ncbi:MAG: hypothetical protein WCJ61_07465 [Paludibacter sp.]